MEEDDLEDKEYMFVNMSAVYILSKLTASVLLRA
jgi:hypothetical protein